MSIIRHAPTLLIRTVALVLLSVPVGSVHGEPRDAPAATSLLPVEDAYPHVSRSGLLVFQSNRVGGSKLFVATSDGSGLRQLTVGAGDDVTPKWSPDGSRIAFASTRDDDIYVVNVDGSALRRLTDNGEDWDTFPSFSPDGSRILFRRLLRGHTSEGPLANSEVMEMNADGSAPTRVVESPYTDVRPQWLPDGRGLVFNRERDGRIEIWQILLPQSN